MIFPMEKLDKNQAQTESDPVQLRFEYKKQINRLTLCESKSVKRNKKHKQWG